MRRRWATAGGLLLLAIGGTAIGLRRYAVATPDSSHSTLALLLTALNGEKLKGYSAAQILRERDAPVVPFLAAAARAGLRPRDPWLLRGSENESLTLALGRPPGIRELAYAQAAARFRDVDDQWIRTQCADRMIDLDAEAARRDLPILMAVAKTHVMPWTRLDTDEGLTFAHQFMEEMARGPMKPNVLYVYLATHPGVRSRRDLDGLFGRAGLRRPALLPRQERSVDIILGLRSLRRLSSTGSSALTPPSWPPLTRAELQDLLRRARASDRGVRESAERELGDRAPQHLAPQLTTMLETGRIEEIRRAIRLGTRDVGALIGLRTHPDFHVRWMVADRLREIGGARAEAGLKRLRRDPARQVRHAAGGR